MPFSMQPMHNKKVDCNLWHTLQEAMVTCYISIEKRIGSLNLKQILIAEGNEMAK